MSHDKDESEASESEAESSASESQSESSASESSSDKKKKKSKKKEKKVKKSKKEKKTKSEKKEKKSKGGKRGPKGAQWMTWKIPYQEKSILGQSFKQAAVKGGIDLKKLTSFVKKAKGTPAFVLRKLRSGNSKGWKWDVDDSHGRLRISHARISDKKWKKK